MNQKIYKLKRNKIQLKQEKQKEKKYNTGPIKLKLYKNILSQFINCEDKVIKIKQKI